jgi:ATP-dependent DNA helicase DinG
VANNVANRCHRIPFPRPDDPLLSARQRAVAALAQGAGRLLRGVDDRGVVAVLDSRMATARYGGYLRASLPPFWPTTDAAAVRAALSRLRSAPGLCEGHQAELGFRGQHRMMRQHPHGVTD